MNLVISYRSTTQINSHTINLVTILVATVVSSSYHPNRLWSHPSGAIVWKLSVTGVPQIDCRDILRWPARRESAEQWPMHKSKMTLTSQKLLPAHMLHPLAGENFQSPTPSCEGKGQCHRLQDSHRRAEYESKPLGVSGLSRSHIGVAAFHVCDVERRRLLRGENFEDLLQRRCRMALEEAPSLQRGYVKLKCFNMEELMVCVCVCARLLLTEEVRRQLRRMSRERASLALKDQSHCNSPMHHQKGIRVWLQSIDHDVCVQHSAKAVSSQRKLGMASCPWTARDLLVSPEKAGGGFSSSRTMHMCLRLVRS